MSKNIRFANSYKILFCVLILLLMEIHSNSEIIYDQKFDDVEKSNKDNSHDVTKESNVIMIHRIPTLAECMYGTGLLRYA